VRIGLSPRRAILTCSLDSEPHNIVWRARLYNFLQPPRPKLQRSPLLIAVRMQIVNLVQARLRVSDDKLANVAWNRQRAEAGPHGPAQVMHAPWSHARRRRVETCLRFRKAAYGPLAAGCRENVWAGEARQALDDFKRQSRKWHLMGCPAFHARRGNRPERGFEIELAPLHIGDFGPPLAGNEQEPDEGRKGEPESAGRFPYRAHLGVIKNALAWLPAPDYAAG